MDSEGHSGNTVLDAGHTWPQGLSWNVAKLSKLAPIPVYWANGCVMPVPTALPPGTEARGSSPSRVGPAWLFPLRKEAEARKKMELARETEEEHALHPAQIPALGNGWRAGLVPSTASQEWTDTHLSLQE